MKQIVVIDVQNAKAGTKMLADELEATNVLFDTVAPQVEDVVPPEKSEHLQFVEDIGPLVVAKSDFMLFRFSLIHTGYDRDTPLELEIDNAGWQDTMIPFIPEIIQEAAKHGDFEVTTLMMVVNVWYEGDGEDSEMMIENDGFFTAAKVSDWIARDRKAVGQEDKGLI